MKHILSQNNQSFEHSQNGGDVKILIDNSSVWDCDIKIEVLTQGGTRSTIGFIKHDNLQNSTTSMVTSIIPCAKYIFSLVFATQNSNVIIELD